MECGLSWCTSHVAHPTSSAHSPIIPRHSDVSEVTAPFHAQICQQFMQTENLQLLASVTHLSLPLNHLKIISDRRLDLEAQSVSTYLAYCHGIDRNACWGGRRRIEKTLLF